MKLSGISKAFFILLGLVNVCYCFRLTKVNKRCDNAIGATLNSLDVTGCTVEPCLVYPHTQYMLTINFTADTLITSARHQVSVLGAGTTIFNKTLSPSDICLLGVRCPIQPGQTVVYTLSLPTVDFPYTFKAGAKFTMTDDNGKKILCFIYPFDYRFA